MNRILTLLLLVILVVGGLWLLMPRSPSRLVAVVKEETWHDFTAPQGKFQVKMPGLPHHATETVNDSVTNEPRLYDFFLASKDNGTIYAVNTIVFPDNKAFDEDFLQKIVQQMLHSNPQNKITSLKINPFRQGKALDFKVENGEVWIDGKAFFDDNTLYILSTTANNEQRNVQEFQQFVDSFKLPGKAK